jgi:hypothetical protein
MANNPKSQQRAILMEDGELREMIDTPQVRLSSIYCIHCGSANRPEARFCYHCGQAFEDQMIDLDAVSFPLHKAKRAAQSELRSQPAIPLTSTAVAMEVLTALFVMGAVITVAVMRSSYIIPFLLFAWVAVTWMRSRRR